MSDYIQVNEYDTSKMPTYRMTVILLTMPLSSDFSCLTPISVLVISAVCGIYN